MSSCKPPRPKRDCGPTDYGGCTTLRQMVDLFLADRRGLRAQEAAWYGDSGVEHAEGIRRAFFALEDVDRRDGHQWTYSKATLSALAKQLACSAAILKDAPGFEELYRGVERGLALQPNRKPLLVYDVTRRLAFRFGCEPGSVYLHAGTEKGANALRRGLGRPRSRPLDDFPTSIRTRLTSEQAEDFLCVASKWLRPGLWD